MPDTEADKVKKALKERGLIHWLDLDFQQSMEDLSHSDLSKLLELCNTQNIDPATVVVDEPNLNYKWYNKKYPFIFNYFPKDITKHSTIIKCNNKLPDTYFNFMAGNYHYSRFLLLQKFWQMGWLEDQQKLFWSAYRSWKVFEGWDDTQKYDPEFLKYMKTKMPYIFKDNQWYNKYPEQIDLGTREQVFVSDYNNTDTYIYENSLISIVIDTFATVPIKANVSDNYENEYTTLKTYKAIIQKRPFILCTGKTPNNLNGMRNLGFKTFDTVWDESYDHVNGTERLDRIKDLCYNISKIDIEQLYNDTYDICEHNYSIITNTDWTSWYISELDRTLNEQL